MVRVVELSYSGKDAFSRRKNPVLLGSFEILARRMVERELLRFAGLESAVVSRKEGSGCWVAD